MGSFSPMHWMIVALVLLVLFGSGRVSLLMGDVARGIKNFRKTMAEDGAVVPHLPPGGTALADATADRVQV
jgi:sec-independent protein translocase protein TatA